MPAPASTTYENMTQALLGVAGSVLAVGGVVATVFLWDIAPLGARLALVVLDATLALFVLTVLVCVIQNLTKRQNLNHRNRGHQPGSRDVRLQIAHWLATELNAALVRRRDGTYYMKVGPVQGRNPMAGQVAGPNKPSFDTFDTVAHRWLFVLADSLDAELVYDGKCGEWYLRWSHIREIEEENGVY